MAPGNEESDLYYHLTKAALGLRSVFDGANLVSVQVISLIGMYDLWSSRRTTPEISWKMVNFSCLLAVSVSVELLCCDNQYKLHLNTLIIQIGLRKCAENAQIIHQ